MRTYPRKDPLPALSTPRSHRRGLLGLIGAVAALTLVPVAPATAVNVVADDQVVQGTQCLGAPCLAGDSAFSVAPLMLKTDKTPAIQFAQTDASLPAHRWDLAGNDANFFLREPGNASALSFRVQSGAPSDGLYIRRSGAVTTVGTVEQHLGTAWVDETGPADDAAILDALRSLPISEYTVNSDSRAAPHLAPLGPAFHTAFGLGDDDGLVAPADMAGVALAAVKALDARVSDISLTPGPAGPAGEPGAAGPRGPAGSPGAAGSVPQDVTEDLARANRRIRALARAKRRQAKLLRKTRRQVRRLLADR